MMSRFKQLETHYDYVPEEDRLYNGRNVVTEKPKFLPTTLFKQYEMCILENPIMVYLENACHLAKTKYNYIIKSIDPRDKYMLNMCFQHIHPKLKCMGNDMYINGRESDIPEFVAEDKPGDPLGPKYMIGIQINGYKTGTNKFVSVVWRLIQVQLLVKTEKTVVPQ